jgi:hypothetical protein
MESWPPRIRDELPVVRGVAVPTQLPDGALTWDFDRIFCDVDPENLLTGWDNIAPVEDDSLEDEIGLGLH